MHTYVLNVMQYSGQRFECNFKRFKEKVEERKLFFGTPPNIFIFSANTATHTCTSLCKILVVSKRALII